MKAKIFSEVLKELRKAKGYSQEDIAAALGIVRQTYSHYETGKRIPNVEILYKLAGLYNISVDDLVQLTVNIDRSDSYDIPENSETTKALNRYIEYFNSPLNKRKFKYLSNDEKDLIYYFNILSKHDKFDIIEFLKIKAQKCSK